MPNGFEFGQQNFISSIQKFLRNFSAFEPLVKFMENIGAIIDPFFQFMFIVGIFPFTFEIEANFS